MLTKQFSLPEWDFVGGETQKRTFTLRRPSGQYYDIPNGIANLAVVEFVNRDMSPVLTQETPVSIGANGKACNVAFALSPSDTKDLDGKYIYQITISDGNGNVAIPSQGIMVIAKNIHKAAIANA